MPRRESALADVAIAPVTMPPAPTGSVPPLTRRQVLRLPELLQVDHQRWQEQQLQTPPLERMRRRSRQLALTYLEAGLDVDETERQLLRLQYHPSIAHESTQWAAQRHTEVHGAGAAAAAGAALAAGG
jgi:hypothetical protein